MLHKVPYFDEHQLNRIQKAFDAAVGELKLPSEDRSTRNAVARAVMLAVSRGDDYGDEDLTEIAVSCARRICNVLTTRPSPKSIDEMHARAKEQEHHLRPLRFQPY